MALKKKKVSKPEVEQLYMLEILVDELDLRLTEKNVDNRECDLTVRVSFVDFPPVDIIADGGKSNKNKGNRLPDERIIESGKSCLFVRAPSDLTRSIKSTPLSVEVYRIPRTRDCRNSRDDDQAPLLCAATTAFLPDSFRERVTAAKDKIDGLAGPCTYKKIYTLNDERGNCRGSVSIYLRLSCFGSSIIDHFAPREKSFVFQGFPLSQRPLGRCCVVKPPDEDTTTREDATNRTECVDDRLLLREILGVRDHACTKVRDREKRTDDDDDDDDDAGLAALTRPKSPPRVSINQPGFEKLTTAEKLNDRKYRSLVYQTYPDEPTCACSPTNRSTHPLMCRSGCARSCCMTLRNPDILKDDDKPSLVTYCVDNLNTKSATIDTVCCDATRMRGGGEEDTLNSEAERNDELTWYADNIDVPNYRLAGGTEFALTGGATTVSYSNSKEADARLPCGSSRSRAAEAIKANCVCPGRHDRAFSRAGTSKCTRKPCVGADCMIRAFKEAQEFVDSLGKVPGTLGLGLMDPSESPYFGTHVDRDYAVRELPSERKKGYPATPPPSPVVQCTASCNTQLGKLDISGIAPPASYMTMAVPGRTGVVREAIPEATLVPVAVKPKKKEDKKEERAEKQKEQEIVSAVPLDVGVGPCGEPKCKSRRKIPGEDRAQETRDIVEEAARKPAVPSTVTAKDKRRRRRLRGKPGPAGDRDAVEQVKVSKRVMRYIYTLGDFYPGIHFGHKNCLDPRLRVPANMGWLWNARDTVSKLKPRIGWKPGAIGRYLNELLKEAKMGAMEEDSRSRSVPSRTAVRPARGRAPLYKTLSYVSVKKLQAKKEGEEEAEPPPTLHIHRKDGTYYVTMYPIKQETTRDDAPRLDEPTKPLQFKIAKNRDDASVASSSTASDMEIEFSPPAAVHRYRRRLDVVHVNTQVRQQEILDALRPSEKKERKKKKGKKEKKQKKERKEKKEKRGRRR